ncbi:MAG: hypothetical protein AAGU11_22745 [Syntrophobacteraceae bacterium]
MPAPGEPGKGVGLGVPIPGGLAGWGDGDGLEGMAGLEKLRLPRLPDDPPPPARAHALDSRTTLSANRAKTVNAIAARAPVFLLMPFLSFIEFSSILM